MDLQSSHSRKIHLLPEHIVDQIKAGEVVERPSALLKELLENSIDAGSTRIDIQIKENGLELISIEDNGEGMDMEDLPYAFCRHATSKISQFDDLYNLHSYGFRGEALASISSIARVTCTSSPKRDPSRGGKIVFYGGKQEEWSPLPSSTFGTSLFVKDLFYNTPARLKFLKSKTSERNALLRVFHAFLLTQPEVSFSIKWDDKEKVLFPACPKDEVQKRVAKIFFKKNPTSESLQNIEQVNLSYEETSIQGFFSKTTSKGASSKAQYFFVNGRMFVDKALHLAFMRSIEGVWPRGEYGHYCFFINLPPEQMDVNVHPGKIHIKFLKPSVIFGLISNCIEKDPNQYPSSNEGSLQENISDESIWSLYSNSSSSNSLPNSDSLPSSSEQGKNYFKITENHFFYKATLDECFIIDINNFIKDLIKLSIKKSSDPKHSTPLLIGEAFSFPKGKIDQNLAVLLSLGFGIERIDTETLILKEVSDILTTLNLQVLISPLLKYTHANDLHDIDQMLLSLGPEINSALKVSRFESLWNKISDNKDFFNNSVVAFKEEHINNIFRGSF